MRVIDFFVVIFLLILLTASLYLLWINLPTEQIEYETFKAEAAKDLPTQSAQFYPNMRYASKDLTYFMASTCTQTKRQRFREATTLLSQRTILTFREVAQQSDADIRITCSEISPEPEQEGHFVAGEGGPSLFINTTLYATILEGEISFYREESCDTPQVALHELLHALGFDHNSNEESIMFPVTSCDQILEQEIIDEINRLYAEPAFADLLIERLNANRSGRYLNFEATVLNQGLVKVDTSTLDIVVDSVVVKTFDVGDIDIGAKRQLTVSNMRIPRNPDSIVFIARTPDPEIQTANNRVTLDPETE